MSALDRWVTPQVRREVEGIAHDIVVWDDDTPAVLPSVLQALIPMLSLECACAHRLAPNRDESVSLDFFVWEGRLADEAEAQIERALEGRRPSTLTYDPARPEKRHRNRAVRPRAFYGAAYDLAPAKELLVRAGLADSDEIRVLVCDGSALLAWIGGWRHDTFGRREAAILEALVPALTKRLRLERDLARTSLPQAALVATLEAVGSAAFIVARGGAVLTTNAAGRALLLRGHKSQQQRLREVIQADNATPGYRVTRVRARGMADHFLVVCSTTTPDAGRRAADLTRLWGLTPRQTEVLSLVVDGHVNKTIATKLGCSLRTVEMHVSRVLHKCGASRRTEIATKFWAH